MKWKTTDTEEAEYRDTVEIITNDLLERVGKLERGCWVSLGEVSGGSTTTTPGEKRTNSYACVGEGCFFKTLNVFKPEWWGEETSSASVSRFVYLEALTACSEASGVKFLLEE